MPNGGSDCCGTCWFNSKAGGEAGYPSGPVIPELQCMIRGFKIDSPFYTYCANHPHHNPDRVDVPIGPVYVTAGYPYAREVIIQSPDTEEIRLRLLEILAAMQEVPRAEYPSPTQLDEEVIKQLMVFGERRAGPLLRRIAQFHPMAALSDDVPFRRNRIATVGFAIEALGAIERDAALDVLDTALRHGLLDQSGASPPTGLLARLRELVSPAPKESSRDDPMASIRYHAVRGLQHCSSERARSLLRGATDDPHPEVAALASELLGSGPT